MRIARATHPITCQWHCGKDANEMEMYFFNIENVKYLIYPLLKMISGCLTQMQLEMIILQ